MDEQKEIILYPGRYTPLKDEELELPDLDFDNGKGDDADKKDGSAPGTSAAKTITLTMGGIAIGVAVGAAGATMLAPPPPLCPQLVVQQKTQTTQALTPKPNPPVPAGGIKATTTPASTTPGAATTSPAGVP